MQPPSLVPPPLTSPCCEGLQPRRRLACLWACSAGIRVVIPAVQRCMPTNKTPKGRPIGIFPLRATVSIVQGSSRCFSEPFPVRQSHRDVCVLSLYSSRTQNIVFSNHFFRPSTPSFDFPALQKTLLFKEVLTSQAKCSLGR